MSANNDDMRVTDPASLPNPLGASQYIKLVITSDHFKLEASVLISQNRWLHHHRVSQTAAFITNRMLICRDEVLNGKTKDTNSK